MFVGLWKRLYEDEWTRQPRGNCAAFPSANKELKAVTAGSLEKAQRKELSKRKASLGLSHRTEMTPQTPRGWGRAARTSCMSPGPQTLHPYVPSLQEGGQAGWVQHCWLCHLPVCLSACGTRAAAARRQKREQGKTAAAWPWVRFHQQPFVPEIKHLSTASQLEEMQSRPRLGVERWEM